MLTLSDYATRHKQRLLLRRLAYSVCLLTVIGSALLLTGCATTAPPPPCACPVLPAKPLEITPQPQITYSENVRLLLSDWRAKLMATPLTQEH